MTGQEIFPLADAEGFHAGTGETGDRRFATTLARGIQVLRAFRPDDPGPLGNIDIARRTGLPKGTVSRFTHTLTALGFLGHDPQSGKYSLGPAILPIAHSYLSKIDVRQTAKRHMAELSVDTGTSVLLGCRDSLSITVIEASMANVPIVLRADLGSRIPIATTAAGHAYLAGVDDAERNGLIQQIRARKIGDWEPLYARIQRDVEDVHRRGFCISNGEWRADAFGVAIPIVGGGGQPVMSLNCGGPCYGMTLEKMEEIGLRLVQIGRIITGEQVRG